MLATRTMLPCTFCFRNCCAAACAHAKVPKTFTSKTRFAMSIDKSIAGPPREIPAQATSPRSGNRADTILSSSMCLNAPSSTMLHEIYLASHPFAFAAVVTRSSSKRQKIATIKSCDLHTPPISKRLISLINADNVSAAFDYGSRNLKTHRPSASGDWKSSIS